MSRTTRATRLFAGILLVCGILYLASLATRDCTVGLYVYDNCLWKRFRELLGLPASKFLRAGFLELIGLTLVAGLYVTLRYVFPAWRSSPSVNTPANDSIAESKSD